MPETNKIFVAEYWPEVEANEPQLPEILITQTTTLEEAQSRFRDYINEYNLGWDKYDMQMHINNNVTHVCFDPPEDDDDDNY